MNAEVLQASCHLFFKLDKPRRQVASRPYTACTRVQQAPADLHNGALEACQSLGSPDLGPGTAREALYFEHVLLG